MYNTIALIFLYTLDRLDDLDKLCSINKNFDISLITNISNKDNNKLKNFLVKYKTRIIYYGYHDNYGVDIAPFLDQLSQLDSNRYPYFIKLHSKKSTLGRYNQVDWGCILWDSLIGNHHIFQQNLKILHQAHTGVVAQPTLIYKDRELNNISKIKILTEHLNIRYESVARSKFMAGTMFMGKTKVFQNILHTNKIEYIKTLLSTETGKVDDREHSNGTFSHSMERIMGYLVTAQNLCIHSSSLYPIIKIYNKQQKKLHLHITYNNTAYIVEDINICGQILNKNEQYIDIQWNHIQNQISTYKFLSKNIIINARELTN